MKNLNLLLEPLDDSDMNLYSNLTSTKGWTEEQFINLIKERKKQLDWDNTTGSARKWWEAFEKENTHRLALVVRLAEELTNREATITEFFLAYVYSNTDNIQGNLHYLDYTRLKKQEEDKDKSSVKFLEDWVGQNRNLSLKILISAELNAEEMEKILQEKKLDVGWGETKDSARKWWEALEVEVAHHKEFLLLLVAEMIGRKITITEFFLAYVYSNTNNIQAILHYVNYSRLKKEEERKKKEASDSLKASLIVADSTPQL